MATWLALDADGELGGLAGLLGAAGCLCLAVWLALRRAETVAPALALVGGEYALLVAIDADVLDTRVPLVAAGLLAAGELAAWSLEQRTVVLDDAGSWWRRLSAILLEAAGASVVAEVLLAAAGAGRSAGGSLVLEGLGALALAAGALVLVRLAAGR